METVFFIILYGRSLTIELIIRFSVPSQAEPASQRRDEWKIPAWILPLSDHKTCVHGLMRFQLLVTLTERGKITLASFPYTMDDPTCRALMHNVYIP